ncbi:hypothetical protein TEQG_05987 [Trichophyton equinum CBS 127.97]|uniref:Secreted protein n=1 Tax=Trichophyton equinum (strain ATCC MYA-4606 / CBS 127.97) TaxID=559882 RepID=F2PYG6_TRIEC|nr:hypothetical protein TEQG_05987 [Trichophyton equinum CBS 127.97]
MAVSALCLLSYAVLFIIGRRTGVCRPQKRRRKRCDDGDGRVASTTASLRHALPLQLHLLLLFLRSETSCRRPELLKHEVDQRAASHSVREDRYLVMQRSAAGYHYHPTS